MFKKILKWVIKTLFIIIYLEITCLSIWQLIQTY